MSVHLNSKYAKRLVAGPGALEEALDAATQECLHAGRPGLDIVCGDISMARPPLAFLFKCASAAPAASSRASALRRSSALLRAALVDPRSCLLRSAALAAACCAAFPRLEQNEPSVVERSHLRCLWEPRRPVRLRLDQ